MLIPLVTITWFFFGWWIYWAMVNGPWIGTSIMDGNSGLQLGGGFGANELANPMSPIMAINLGDHINGVFWAAFLLFSWTAASIVSGAVIERIRISAFGILAIAIGSVFWTIDASWGWHFDGWMVKILGYHDAYASGVIHAVAGGFALGVLCVLGPRIGKFASDGTPRNIGPRNPWLVAVGLFLIYTGFWGFYAACNIPIFDFGPEYGLDGTYFSATNIYVTPTTLSGITFNFLMSLSGGLLAGYWVSKGDPFWTYSSGLAGIITASAGTSNFRAGVNAGNSIASGGNYNVAVGDEAGTAITTSDYNTLVGYAAGAAVTTAQFNTLIGSESGDALTSGGYNTAVGVRALSTEDGHGNNVAIGYEALKTLNAGADGENVAVGILAGASMTTGVQNVLIGSRAGDVLSDADKNVVMGYQALTTDTENNSKSK